MKKIIKTAAYFLMAFAVFGCAKTAKVGPNDANIRYFSSWMKLNHPDLKPTGLGIYVLENEEGTGSATVKEDGYVYIDYVKTDLDGNITDYTDKNTAKQLGEYDTTYYYGPRVRSTTAQALPAGVAEAIQGMKAGGRKKVIIPSWLMSYYDYKTEQEYIDKTTNTTSAIYDITIRDYADSIGRHEILLIRDYIEENASIFKNVVNDTTGFFFQAVDEGDAGEKYDKDTTFYINYTGKLLNGLVFDTTIEKVAKDNGLYKSTKTYEPQKVSWGEKWSEIKLGDSSVIPGFALTLWHMNPMSKAIGVFYSDLGYESTGSGKSIPGYMPLIFEIEIVEKPED